MQKGTLGFLYQDSDMPTTKDGMKPDLIFSTHSIPTRMTIGVLLEGMLGKICAHKGASADATMFKKFNIDNIADELEKYNYNKDGTERLYDGKTGMYINTPVFIVPIFYQRLQKFTVDTVYGHGTSPSDSMTRQGLEGKKSLGSLRQGEMENSCMSTNSINLLHEKMVDHADKFDIYICTRCSKRAVVNEHSNPKIYKCNYCKNEARIQRFPSTWSSNLTLNEFESMNIGIKLHMEPNQYEELLE